MSGKDKQNYSAQNEKRELAEDMQSDEFLALARFAMDRNADSITWVDHDGRLVYVNDAACSSLGYTKEELLRMKIFDIDPIFPPEKYEDHKNEMRQKGAMRFESVHKTKDGRLFPVEVSTNYYEYKGRFLGIAYARNITDRKLAEKALLESEKKFRAIFNNVPIGIFQSSIQGGFTSVNPAMARMFGYADPEEMLEAIEGQAGIVYADPVIRQKLLEDVQQPPHDLTKEVVLKHKDGFSFYGLVNMSMQPELDDTKNVIHGTIEDITDRKRAVEALRYSEMKFSTLFRVSPDSIMLIDLETQVIVDINDTFIRRSGISKEDIIGKTTAELNIYHDESQRQKIYEQLERYGRVENMEVEFKNKNGGTGVYSISANIVSFGGKSYLLIISRNITAMKKMQQVMVQTEKMISVGGIAAGLAHEINNPLGIVLQAVQNMKQRTRPDFAKNIEAAEKVGLDLNLLAEYMQARKLDLFIRDIESAAQRASGIIRHMLNFSRKSESRRTICHIKEIVSRAIELANSDFDLKKSYDFKKINITFSIDDMLPEINCTETEIEQVMLNLLRNAAQAMATADPPIQDPKIDIRVFGFDEWVRIEIEDNGPGMSKELQRRVFEPFFTTKESGEGTGLGLSVSYFIITTGHSGRFIVLSEPGKGAKFVIELPTEAIRESL